MNVKTDLKSGAACYVVKSGDTLSSIASKFGTSVTAVYQSNYKTIGQNPNVIYPGQKLYIPS